MVLLSCQGSFLVGLVVRHNKWLGCWLCFDNSLSLATISGSVILTLYKQGDITNTPQQVKIIACGGQTLAGWSLALVVLLGGGFGSILLRLLVRVRAFARLSVLAGWVATPLTPCGSITLRVLFGNTFAPCLCHLWRVGLWVATC